MTLPIKAILSAAALLLGCAVAAAADPLTGRWQINGDGAVVDIVESGTPGGTLSMLWVDGPEDISLDAGTVIGTITPAPNVGTYDCHALVNPSAHRKGRRRYHDFTVTLSKDDINSLTFTEYRRTSTVSLWRWIPYLFRVTVINSSNRPGGLDGARRVDAPPTYIVL